MRSSIGSTALYGQLRNEVRRIDNAMPVFGMKTLERQLDETLLTDRLVALLAAGFGLLAAALASIGLYGVMAFVVARRRKELGIRIALGATRGGVIWMVMREVLTLLGIGLLVGVPAAYVLLTVRQQPGRHPALWRAAARPAGRRPDGAPADHRDGAGRPDPGAARQPDQPDHGAPLRVERARHESVWNGWNDEQAKTTLSHQADTGVDRWKTSDVAGAAPFSTT